MKLKLTMAAALVCLLATALFAQNPERTGRQRPTAEQMARRMTERMQKSLELDAQQTEQVYRLRLDQIRREEARREALRKEHEADEETLRGILSGEQYARWKKQRQRAGGPGAQRPGGMGPRGGAHGGFPGMDGAFGAGE